MADAIQSSITKIRKPRPRPLPSVDRISDLLEYDADTGTLTWRQGLRARRIGTAGHLRRDGYIDVGIDGTRYMAHRIIWKMVTGCDPADEIDHIDGCRSNNRWLNLRSAKRIENCRNTTLSSRNTSGFKGVSFDRAENKWRANIKIAGRQKSLGYFADPRAAHEAYVKAANNHFGAFAKAALGVSDDQQTH